MCFLFDRLRFEHRPETNHSTCGFGGFPQPIEANVGLSSYTGVLISP